MRRAYRALYRGQEFLGAVRTRGHHFEDVGGRAVLLRAARAIPGRSRRPRGQRLCQGCAAAAADGIRGGSAEADLDLAGRQRRVMSAYWFKPKERGYGNVPTTWQGWTLTAGFAALVVAMAVAVELDALSRFWCVVIVL